MTMLGFVRLGFGEIWCAEVCDSKLVGLVHVAAPRRLTGMSCEVRTNQEILAQAAAGRHVHLVSSHAERMQVTQEMVGG
jgi:hypothetical protein